MRRIKKRVGTWFGYGWATPVVSRRWAFIATVLQAVTPGPGCGGPIPHRAWERACGIAKIS